jgi:hypothetical protein
VKSCKGRDTGFRKLNMQGPNCKRCRSRSGRYFSPRVRVARVADGGVRESNMALTRKDLVEMLYVELTKLKIDGDNDVQQKNMRLRPGSGGGAHPGGGGGGRFHRRLAGGC